MWKDTHEVHFTDLELTTLIKITRSFLEQVNDNKIIAEQIEAAILRDVLNKLMEKERA
jgi:hypothetical protein